MSDFGHNGGPPRDPLTPTSKVEHIRSTLERVDLTAVQKCVAVWLIASADRDWIASARTEDLKRVASSRDRETVFAATKALDQKGILAKDGRRGQAGRYTILPPRVVDEIINAYKNTQSGRVKPDYSHAEWSGETGRVQRDNPVGFDPTSAQKVVGLNPTGRVEAVGFDPTSRAEPDQSLADASRARIEPPSGVLTSLPDLLPLNPKTTESQIDKGVQGEIFVGGAAPKAEPPAKRAPPRLKPTMDQFNRFWAAYPIRKGKPKALERFMALSPSDAEKAIIGAQNYAAECQAEAREDRFVKWPQGWLSERRFADVGDTDPREALRGPDGEKWGWWRGKEATLRNLPEDRWRDAFHKLKPNGTWPWWKLTAPPGDPECLMPERLIKEFRLDEVYQGQVTHD